MAEILLVNPRKRGSAKKRKTAKRRNPVAKKRRTAAQKRATAKMIAANRRRSKGRRKNPVKRKTTRRKRAPAVATRRRTRRRRNPAVNMRSVQNQVMEAGTGALGAIGLGIIQGYLPIPANLKGGLVGTGVKALLAIGMGVVASKVKVVKPATAAKLANGALTVVLYDALKTQIATFAPGLQMGAYIDDPDSLGYYGSGYPAGVAGDGYGGMGVYLPEIQNMNMGMEQDGLGAYVGEPEYFEDMSYS